MGGRVSRTALCTALMLSAAVVAACGKKGPPLAPLRLVPEAPADVSLRRVGDKALLRFTLPKKNQNGPGTVELDRVEIYAMTIAPGAVVPPDRELLTGAHVVGTVSVKPAPVEDQPADEKASEDKRPSPGDAVTYTEELTPAVLEPAPAAAPKAQKPSSAAAASAAAATPPSRATYPVRIYVARGLTRGGRRGMPTPRQQLPLLPLPPSPADVLTMFNERAVTLVWLPPAGDLGVPGGAAAALASVAQPATETVATQTEKAAETSAATTEKAPTEAAARPDKPAAAGPGAGAGATPAAPAGAAAQSIAYNVYTAGMDAPLNPAPLPTGSFDHAGAEFGKEQCFTVRAMVSIGSATLEGPPSSPTCITPRDIFPPDAPKGLAAVAGPGAVNLIWDANTETDLAGYLVLRGEAPGTALQPLTPAPIRETHYTDSTVKPGVRYVYVVLALDNATPPNRSAPTTRVEETAR